MIGLEFACKVFKKENKELAEKLKISAPNISAWLKGTREIPAKYLTQLSKIFSNLPAELFQKEITYADELRIRIHFIEYGLPWDERHGELTVFDTDNKLVLDEFIDDYEDELKRLRDELAKTLKISSYNDQLHYLFEQLRTHSNEQLITNFGTRSPEDFVLAKLNNYLSFLTKFESEHIDIVDSIIHYLVNYRKIVKSDWMNQSLFPNEKMLAFYSDFEELLKKHQLIEKED